MSGIIGESPTSDSASTPAGDPRVDAILRRLDDLDGMDLPAQLSAFTEMHDALAAVLDGVESTPTSTPPVS